MSEQPGSVVVANIAAVLLKSGGPLPPDARELSEAIKLASQLLEAASKPLKRQAYELFPRDAVMGLGDIAKVFEEYQWSGLGARNTVDKYIKVILKDMYRNIETRRAFLASAAREKLPSLDPAAAAIEARKAITSLLHEIGMGAAFERNIDVFVDQVWWELADAWTVADGAHREKMKCMKLVSPALFAEACVDSSYTRYAEALRPPPDLGGDQMTDVALWLDGEFRQTLLSRDDAAEHEALDTLCVLDGWLEYLCPGDRRYSNAFAECIVALSIPGDDARESRAREFESGLRRFGGILGKVLLVEFSRKFDAESLIPQIEEMVRCWDEMDEGRKAELTETLIGDPVSAMDTVKAFLQTGVPYFNRRFPFVATVRYGFFRQYIEDLDSLRNALEELKGLATQSDWKFELLPLEESIRNESRRVKEVAKGLADPADQARRDRMAEGKKLIAQSKFILGRVNPHLLFRYAAERSLETDTFTKRVKVDDERATGSM
jgi:hypothetical protein